jgi:hypothetical protein
VLKSVTTLHRHYRHLDVGSSRVDFGRPGFEDQWQRLSLGRRGSRANGMVAVEQVTTTAFHPRGSNSLTLRGARPRYPIAQVIVTVAEPWYRTGASGPVAPGSAPPLELPDPTATPGWGAASIIG